jgi:hypothetical protein
MMTQIDKAAKQCKISSDMAYNIVISEHELQHFSKDFVSLEIDLSKDAVKRIKIIAKTLKVSFNAVVTGFLLSELKKHE